MLDGVARQAAPARVFMVAGWCLAAKTMALIVQFGGGPAPEGLEAGIMSYRGSARRHCPWWRTRSRRGMDQSDRQKGFT